jgi:GNAT superfamily N-acetyltransferase
MTDDRYHVENFAINDAEKIPELFLEVYGDGYPVQMVYRPEEIVSAYEQKWYFPFLVKNSDENVIAFGALYQSAPFKGIYEFGQGVVRPEYQGTGIGRLLFEHVSRYAPTLPGSVMYFGEAVCNHIATQKSGARIQTTGTGIEVDLLPYEAYTKDRTVTGRISVLDMFRTYQPRPHVVCLPEIYDSILRDIYQHLDDERTLARSASRLPGGKETILSYQVFQTARVARITVLEAGSDLPGKVAALDRNLMDQGMAVIQVWIKLSWPWSGAVTEILRDCGYFFGGLFPRWFDDDGLLMQKVVGMPNWEGIHLYSPESESILKRIYADWSDMYGESHMETGY